MSNYVTKRLPNAKLLYFLAALSKFTFTLCVVVELYYLSAYLTDVAVFQNAIVVLILSLTAVIDLIGSFFISPIMELFNFPWGKVRSWLLIAPPIVLVFYTMNFVRVSENEVLSAVLIIIAYSISHIVWSCAEAACNTMSMVCTDDPDERANFSVWLGRGANFAILPFAAISGWLLKTFDLINPALSYAGLTATLTLCYLLGFWALFFATRYTNDAASLKAAREASKARPKKEIFKDVLLGFKYTFTNAHLVVTIITLSATNCVNSILSATVYYVFTYTFCDYTAMSMDSYIMLTGVAKIIGALILIPILNRVFKKSKKKVYNATMMLQGIFGVLAFFVWQQPVLCIVLLVISIFFGSVPMIVFLSLYQDCAIFSEYKSKRDVSSFIMGMSIMPIKVGNVIRSFVLSGFLVAIGYTAAAPDPHVYAADFAFLHMLICGLIVIGASIAHIIIYRLPEDKVLRMQTINNKRRGLIAAGLPIDDLDETLSE